jgi:hypothetical protein
VHDAPGVLQVVVLSDPWHVQVGYEVGLDESFALALGGASRWSYGELNRCYERDRGQRAAGPEPIWQTKKPSCHGTSSNELRAGRQASAPDRLFNVQYSSGLRGQSSSGVDHPGGR